MRHDVKLETKSSNKSNLILQTKTSRGNFQEGRQWITPYIPYLKLDTATQTRIREDRAIIKKYGKLMFEGNWNWFEIGEPIVLFWDQAKAELYCGDGHHRIKAAREQYLHQIYVEVRFGTLLDALIHNCTSNGSHGKPTTNRDKRRQIKVLLNSLSLLPTHDSRRLWSDRKIASQIGVDHKTVGKIRRELEEPQNQDLLAEKKDAQKKRKRFYNFRKLIQESDPGELSDYLSQVETDELFKLKSVIDRIVN